MSGKLAGTLRAAVGKSRCSAVIFAFALAVTVLWAPALAVEPRIIDPSARYPEGPVAADGGLYYAEMGTDRVHFAGPGGRRVVWEAPGCLPTSVETYRDDLLVLCHRPGVLALVSREGDLRGTIAADSAGQRFVTPNASAPDGQGGIYFSSAGLFSPGAPSVGAVLYLAANGRLTRVAEGIHYANGVAVSDDGQTLFVSEHLARNVLAFDVADDGALSGRRVAAHLDDLVGADPTRGWEVGPDGLAVDAAGNLYVAEYGGGRVLVVSPGGELLHEISVPERYVTSAEPSPDEKTLYVTAPAATDPTVPGKVYAIDNPAAP